MSLIDENIGYQKNDQYDDDDDDDGESLVIRRTTSYSMPGSLSNATGKLSARQVTDKAGVDRAVTHALKSHPKIFHYRQKHLKHLPASISNLARCENLREIDLSGNELQSLPDELGNIVSIESCNFGNNHFSEIPQAFGLLPNLTKLILFNNRLSDLSKFDGFNRISNIRILNLNHNSITVLPPSISRLVYLEVFTMEHNQLRELPREIGFCRRLVELNLGYNQLTKIPLEIGYLTELKRLIIHRNNLLELPESITNLKTSLKHLDVACNALRIFPSRFHTLQLTEFHAEGNPFLERTPIHSIQESEILSLKEICARRAMSELRHPTANFQPSLRERVQHQKRAKEILMQCTECQYCHNYFLNTWLECVEFIDVQRTFKGTKNTAPQSLAAVPQRALLCSYECFNSPGHNYFGVAFG